MIVALALLLLALATALHAGAWWGGRRIAARLLGGRSSQRPWRGLHSIFGPALAYLVCAGLVFADEAVVGHPQASTTVDVMPGSVAERAGMRSGDRILAIDGRPIARWEEVPAAVEAHSGPALRVSVARGSEQLEVAAELAGGRLGVMAHHGTARRAPLAAAASSFVRPLEMLFLFARSTLGGVMGERVEVLGPPAIVRSVRGTANAWGSTWHLLVLIAVFLWPGTWLLELAAVRRERRAPLRTETERLATRAQRGLAASIDIGLLILVPLIAFAALDLLNSVELDDPLWVLAVLPVLLVQWTLIARTGQSIGKRLLGTRIVLGDGTPAGFVHGVLLREWLLLPFRAVPLLGSVVGLGDALAIFRRSRCCLHDDVAGTWVVRAPR